MNQSFSDIWQIQATLLDRLLGWSRLSIVTGLGLWRSNAFWRGVGLQAIGWGLINGAIAVWGGRAMRRRATLPDAATPAALAQESRKLRQLLWFNAGLDLFYILGGLTLIRTRGVQDHGWRGHGWGIIIQGGFLFLFDLYHALQLNKDNRP